MRIFITVFSIVLLVSTVSGIYYLVYYKPSLDMALLELEIAEQEALESMRLMHIKREKDKCFDEAKYKVEDGRRLCDQKYEYCNIYFDPQNDCSVYINPNEGFCVAEEVIEKLKLNQKADEERCMLMYGLK